MKTIVESIEGSLCPEASLTNTREKIYVKNTQPKFTYYQKKSCAFLF